MVLAVCGSDRSHARSLFLFFLSQDKQASGEPASTPASGGILPSESYAASRTLLDLAGVRTRQHAPATPLTLRVDPLRVHAKAA